MKRGKQTPVTRPTQQQGGEAAAKTPPKKLHRDLKSLKSNMEMQLGKIIELDAAFQAGVGGKSLITSRVKGNLKSMCKKKKVLGRESRPREKKPAEWVGINDDSKGEKLWEAGLPTDLGICLNT